MPNISGFLNDIMNVKGMELDQEKVSGEFEGMPFFKVFTTLKDRYETIPVGFVREDKVIINPEKGVRFEKDDEILYIAKKKIGLVSISGSSVKLSK